MSREDQIIYKQLLQRHKRIQVPMIQRDYAQGRPAESTVRELFLMALDEALRKPVDDPTLPLNLDFVYGSVEGSDDTRFLPLDGQQRLTTLFLLHWYLAWRDEEWTVFKDMFITDKHARFTYDVRPSSKEFFDELVCFRPALRPEDVPEREHPITDLLADQPWYFRRWRLDPTIQAVLHMLDAIHRRFASSSGLYARLIDESHPAITFQLLDLENFGLSDDLYIKMNARGKPLTPFETFKARYEEELKYQLSGKVFVLAGHRFNAADYVARRIDTTWADLFWKLRDPSSHQYDEAFMNLARAVALVTRNPDDESYLDDVTMLRRGQEVPSYTEFHERGWFDERFTLALIRLLDSWSMEGGILSRLLPDSSYFDERRFFDEIALKGGNLTYAEIIQLAAYVTFVEKYHDSYDAAAFQEWMRISYNLSTNTIYNRVDDFRRSIRGLEGLLENADDILRHFARAEKAVAGFFEPQIAEEKLKAKLILADITWRKLIDRAEYHGYFQGQIGFILDFCGAFQASENLDPSLWEIDKHVVLQADFDRYLTLAEKTFSESGLTDLDEPHLYRWQRALLSIGDYLLPRGRNHSFLVNTATDETSWKRLLRGTGTIDPEPREFLKRLWDQLDPNEELKSQLDAIINASEDLEPWREALVHCPQAFRYCRRSYIRKYATNTYYLLERTQLNGYHAELFTYCLYNNLRPNFEVLKTSYQPVSDLYSEPALLLRCKLKDVELMFSVLSENHGFKIQLEKNDRMEIAKIEKILETVGHSDTGDCFEFWSTHPGIEAHLNALDEALNSGFS